MALLLCTRKAGAQSAFSSPIKAEDGAVMIYCPPARAAKLEQKY
jgi:hypothetical protein